MWDAEAGSSSEESSGDQDEDTARWEERIARRVWKADEKKRMRGTASGIKKALRKRRREVIDP
jgi:U3 small nucleolar RNA-associated protein 7